MPVVQPGGLALARLMCMDYASTSDYQQFLCSHCTMAELSTDFSCIYKTIHVAIRKMQP